MRVKVQVGPATRTRKQQAKYIKHLANNRQTGCLFCKLDHPEAPDVVRKTRQFIVAQNGFPYSIWDGCLVEEHLMLIPKKHVTTLGELPDNHLVEYAKLCAEYEAKGYSLYSRSPNNVTKSITHQHTHLLKLRDSRRKFLLYIRAPHVLLFR